MQNDWDIFCAVIDNYGDIGVCWRLARQIAVERGEAVRLWVDDLQAFAVLCPEVDPALAEQQVQGVTVCRWGAPFPAVSPAAVVIEAFACNPPESFLAAMAVREPKPVWINLEYLSAEDWVEGCHALGSRHPRLPLSHHFFFPGFNLRTGGLLREEDLLPARLAWQEDGAARAALLGCLGASGEDLTQDCVSLFCYENPALGNLLDGWQGSDHGLTLLVAAGKPQRLVEAWLGTPFPAGRRVRRGGLTLLSMPFLSQEDYDRLLWSCDFNFVRGEDSLVRALWAARPLCWHIYPQEEAAHLVKLDAFLDRYAPHQADAPLAAFWRAWNDGDGPRCSQLWRALRVARRHFEAHAVRESAALSQQPDLLSQLSAFVGEKQRAST
ncbi:elongation factor P maturation arginine rhamnosyltransferase EarP [Chitinimonas sp.]|uniref:elongation factor P maturation arginine rhamnosyltransferase EarP n=1 Tax=Chitinimonas sp. TaxID=1934313 RepID=UPI002F947B63